MDPSLAGGHPKPSARRGFGTALFGLATLAFAARVIYGLTVARKAPLVADGLEYDQLGQLIAGGHGYVNWLGFYLLNRSIPIATFPPLYPLILALFDKLGAIGWAWHQVGGAVFGAGAVAGVGLLGRRISGERAGLVSAGIAALYPVLIVSDTSLRSEAVYAPLIVFSLLAAYRLRERPSRSRAAILGALIGLAALTRSEAVFLLPLLALPAVWRLERGRRVMLFAATTLAAALVISPWFVRCWITFGRPVPLSTNSGTLLAGSNCHDTYYGPLLGSWSLRCSGRAGPGDEVTRAARERRAGISYATHHTGRLPVVIAARIGRTWDVYRPAEDVTIEAMLDGHNRTAGLVGLATYYALLPLALVGAMVLRRRRETLWILLTPVALVTLVTILGYGISRFRIAADISIVLLAAVAADELLRRGLMRTARSALAR